MIGLVLSIRTIPLSEFHKLGQTGDFRISPTVRLNTYQKKKKLSDLTDRFLPHVPEIVYLPIAALAL